MQLGLKMITPDQYYPREISELMELFSIYIFNTVAISLNSHM